MNSRNLIKLSCNGQTLIKVDEFFSGELKVPDGVVTIEESAAEGCWGITSIVLPESVKHVKYAAFHRCTRVRRVSLSESLETIDSFAFAFDSNHIGSIVLHNNVHKISGSSFDTTLYIANDNPYMYDKVGPNGECMVFCNDGEKLLYYHDKEKHVVLPKGIKIIGKSVFEAGYLSHITSISIPETVKEIGELAFAESWIEEIDLPYGLENIGNSAFAGSTINRISLPSTLKGIESEAFESCEYLKSVVIPKDVEYIGRNAFPPNCNLQVVAANSHYRVEDNVLYSFDKKTIISYCSNDSTFCIPNTVETIASDAFYGRYNLKMIVIPSSVKVIGDGAFYGCKNIERIEMSDGVEIIGNEAFANLKSLKSIRIPDTIKYIGKDAFKNDNRLSDFWLDTSNLCKVSIADDIFGVPPTCLEVHIKKDLQGAIKRHNAFKDALVITSQQ